MIGDGGGESGEAVGHAFIPIGEGADEFGVEAGIESEEVVKNEYLAVGVDAGADADGGNAEGVGDIAGQIGGQAFEHQAEATGGFGGARLTEQIGGGGLGTALDFIAAEGVDGLGREAHMTKDGNAGLDQMPDDVFMTVDPLDFYGVGTGAHKQSGAIEGGGNAAAGGEERKVGDDEFAAGAAHDGLSVAGDDFGCGGEGVRFAIEQDREAIAHEDTIDGGGGDETGLPVSVGGDHADLGALAFTGFELEDGLHTERTSRAKSAIKAMPGLRRRVWQDVRCIRS